MYGPPLLCIAQIADLSSWAAVHNAPGWDYVRPTLKECHVTDSTLLEGTLSPSFVHQMELSIFFIYKTLLQVALRTFNTIVWAVLPNSFVYLGIYAYWALISS